MQLIPGNLIKKSKVNSLQQPEETDFLIEKLLGKGGFAQCFQVQDTVQKTRFALKAIDKASIATIRHKKKLYQEISLQQSLQSRYIVKVEDVFEDEGFIYIQMELCPNQTLSDLLKRRGNLTELEIKVYGLHLLQALFCLKQKLILHRDLKNSNLFLGEFMELKLGDFGLAAQLKSKMDRRYTVCGTPNYIAPEVLSKSG